MLWMIQRVFYGHLGPKPRALAAGIVLPDLGAREQISLWPLIILMLVMGVASPFWMRAIDSSGTQLADRPAVAAAPHVIVLSSATFAPPDSDTGATSAKGGK
jgi:NADH-quinone oxidoreductase subunit M